jgi:ketosteroid isomerase-like protein
MSRENVDRVRAAIDSLNKGDIEAVFKDAAADFEYDFSRSIGMQPGIYRLAETRRFLEDFIEWWDSARWEADDFIDAGDHVVTPLTGSFRGRDGIQVQARGTAWVWTFRGTNIVRVTFYQERGEALEALGLSQ